MPDTPLDVQLDPVDAASVASWYRATPPYRPPSDAGLRHQELLGWANRLPHVVRDEVTAFAARLGSAGVLRLRGVPLPADLPPTPAGPRAEPTAGTEMLVLAVASLAGDLVPFGEFGDAYGGRRLHNLYPSPHEQPCDLGLHTEFIGAAAPPDVLVLLCLRSGPEPLPPSRYCDLRTVWRRLDEDDRERLSEAQFGIRARSESGAPQYLRPVAAPWGDGLRFIFRTGHPTDWDMRVTVGATAEHDAVVARVAALIRQETVEATLEAGDLAVIDNVHVMHGRAALTVGRDGNGRWLQRAYTRVGNGGGSLSGDRDVRL